MRNPWFYKDTKDAISQLKMVSTILSKLSSEQINKLVNYPKNLIGCVNYGLSEERNALFNELNSSLDYILASLSSLINK